LITGFYIGKPFAFQTGRAICQLNHGKNAPLACTDCLVLYRKFSFSIVLGILPAMSMPNSNPGAKDLLPMGWTV
jgi:hypothetical protein